VRSHLYPDLFCDGAGHLRLQRSNTRVLHHLNGSRTCA
jgi:hypothetical protein